VTRRGKRKEDVAVGHTILTIAYHLLSRGTEYTNVGVHYFDEQHVTRRLTAVPESFFTAVVPAARRDRSG
jgi:hypothetical protein